MTTRFLALVVIAAAGARAGGAQEAAGEFLSGSCPRPDSSALADLGALVGDPDEQPRYLGGQPRYPKELFKHGYAGSVQLAFAVDTAGRIVAHSAAVLRSTDPRLSRWACSITPLLRFAPARKNGQPVMAQASQSFSFSATVKGRRP